MASSTQQIRGPDVWWVYQGANYRVESAGAYVWAPLVNTAGWTHAHWMRLAEVQPGDVIVHYSHGSIRAVSHVQTAPREAVCPRPDDATYGGRKGRLIETFYYKLHAPIPLQTAVQVGEDLTGDHPFDRNFGPKQGYLFEFGKPAFAHLVELADIRWPRWVGDFVHDDIPPPVVGDEPLLGQFVDELKNMNTDDAGGARVLCKPLLVLAAMRTIVEGDTPRFRAPLLAHYEAFATAVEADPSAPEMPYFDLAKDEFWQLVDAGGRAFVAEARPGKPALQRTHGRFAGERGALVRDNRLRPLLLGALRTHFEANEWERLCNVWGELMQAPKIPKQSPAAEQHVRIADLTAVADDFTEALSTTHLRFDGNFVRTFIASLATKPFAILTGLSGSGKTQLALQFGNWLGSERMLLVPVRPDWTGSDALFGYEDALRPVADDGRRAWYVPEALQFMLRAARDEDAPYLLILDEMNLAHVERYFADVLSGMESGEPCLPNLAREADGNWRFVPGERPTLPVPENLFIVGTVNVDETTYMFSPKVLDRANTLEFRVHTSELSADLRRPLPCRRGPESLAAAFLTVARDPEWHRKQPHPEQQTLTAQLRALHRLLYATGFEFGHRSFMESVRFAAMMAAIGELDANSALDAIVMQKILPRLHGGRRQLEPVLSSLGAFCFGGGSAGGPGVSETAENVLRSPGDATADFDPLHPPANDEGPRLPRSFAKVQRMTRNVRANQFASFAE